MEQTLYPSSKLLHFYTVHNASSFIRYLPLRGNRIGTGCFHQDDDLRGRDYDEATRRVVCLYHHSQQGEDPPPHL